MLLLAAAMRIRLQMLEENERGLKRSVIESHFDTEFK